jgi:lathosterol oxidase
VFFLLLGTICHYLYFDKALEKHPKYQKNQIRHEIYDSLLSLFGLNVLTVPIFVAQVRGYAKLYDFGSGGVPLWYEFGQFLFFVLFSDTCMYWLHRTFHIKLLFNLMHKKHHQ